MTIRTARRAKDAKEKSLVSKRSIVIAGHKTSFSVEDAFWKGLKEIAAIRAVSLRDLVVKIDRAREHENRSSAIRLFVLRFYRDRFLRERAGVEPASP
jgi:predicted DNA-binding ribbon-helix-helix protein